jgi:MOSC domain-containing protein
VWIHEIWRYPIKSMAGERLQCARLTPAGMEGDRIVQVVNAQGRIVTARTRPQLLGFKATLDGDGEPRIDGRPWTDPAVQDAVRRAAGPGARLVRDESLSRFDVLPLLVATDGAIAEFGHDRRRLRPNIIVGGVAGLEEREWEGGRLVIDDVTIGIQDLRRRCVMTTVDPDTLVQDLQVLREIVRRFDGVLALNCDVLVGGEIFVGQRVRFSPHAVRPHSSVEAPTAARGPGNESRSADCRTARRR